ncbi:MAG TPA: hypothetical protein VFE18_07050 [Phenylobacterium sp.]|uniref:hypothetical protein n=1 Tax=Phenylobacterium sp. TaxID=1871053 RepID=UPI002D6495C3|nr:hypothetical protein [Phenylobacterium sp.]HZZ67913.1 hypothetical protein [Phenylobacterium sp.]
MGVSAGALVAAGLRCPQLVARVFVEPFFSTAKLEPLAAVVRDHQSEISEPFWPWLWTVLGISAEAIEDRRYEHLLVGDLPIYAVVGDVPLSKPITGQLPSLTDEADRARLAAVGARLRIARGGHDLPFSDRDAITETVLAATQGRA